jgi:hypothetical protein
MHNISTVMRWARHIARMWEGRGIYRFCCEKPEGNSYLEDPGIDGRIILRCIFRKWDVMAWTGLIWLRMGTGGGHL